MKIEYNNPEFPKGTEFSVFALGTLVNGESVDFSGEEVDFFENDQGRSIEEAFSGNPHIKVGGKKTFVEPDIEAITISGDEDEMELPTGDEEKEVS